MTIECEVFLLVPCFGRLRQLTKNSTFKMLLDSQNHWTIHRTTTILKTNAIRNLYILAKLVCIVNENQQQQHKKAPNNLPKIESEKKAKICCFFFRFNSTTSFSASFPLSRSRVTIHYPTKRYVVYYVCRDVALNIYSDT